MSHFLLMVVSRTLHGRSTTRMVSFDHLNKKQRGSLPFGKVSITHEFLNENVSCLNLIIPVITLTMKYVSSLLTHYAKSVINI